MAAQSLPSRRAKIAEELEQVVPPDFLPSPPTLSSVSPLRLSAAARLRPVMTPEHLREGEEQGTKLVARSVLVEKQN